VTRKNQRILLKKSDVATYFLRRLSEIPAKLTDKWRVLDIQTQGESTVGI
jgi:hypothetical protein